MHGQQNKKKVCWMSSGMLFLIGSRFRSQYISQIRRWRQEKFFALYNRGWIAGKDRNSSAYLPPRLLLYSNLSSTYWPPRFLSVLKGEGCQFGHLPPSSVENYKTHHFYVDLNMDRYVCGPPIHLAHGYCTSLPGVKQRGCGADFSPPYNAAVRN